MNSALVGGRGVYGDGAGCWGSREWRVTSDEFEEEGRSDCDSEEADSSTAQADAFAGANAEEGVGLLRSE